MRENCTMKDSSEIAKASTQSQHDRQNSSTERRQSTDVPTTSDVHGSPPGGTTVSPFMRELYRSHSSEFSRPLEGGQSGAMPLREARSSEQLRLPSQRVEDIQATTSSLRPTQSFDGTSVADVRPPLQRTSSGGVNPLTQDLYGSRASASNRDTSTPIRPQMRRDVQGLSTETVTAPVRNDRRQSGSLDLEHTQAQEHGESFDNLLAREVPRSTEGTATPPVVEEHHEARPAETNLGSPSGGEASMHEVQRPVMGEASMLPIAQERLQVHASEQFAPRSQVEGGAQDINTLSTQPVSQEAERSSSVQQRTSGELPRTETFSAYRSQGVQEIEQQGSTTVVEPLSTLSDVTTPLRGTETLWAPASEQWDLPISDSSASPSRGLWSTRVDRFGLTDRRVIQNRPEAEELRIEQEVEHVQTEGKNLETVLKERGIKQDDAKLIMEAAADVLKARGDEKEFAERVAAKFYERDHEKDWDIKTLLTRSGIKKNDARIITDVIKTGAGVQELFDRLSASSRKRDQTEPQNVETLLTWSGMKKRKDDVQAILDVVSEGGDEKDLVDRLSANSHIRDAETLLTRSGMKKKDIQIVTDVIKTGAGVQELFDRLSASSPKHKGKDALSVETLDKRLGMEKRKDDVQAILDVVGKKGDGKELLDRLSANSRERDVQTLLNDLGIKGDSLEPAEVDKYEKAREYAKELVDVIWTGRGDEDFNNARKSLLKLAPKRLWLRSLVNPKKDVIDWHEASWRNRQAMDKLDTRTKLGKFRKVFYQGNQWIAGPTNTRAGNLTFIGTQAVVGTAYTWYIEGRFPTSTLVSTLEYAATARFFYSLLPNPINQGIDTSTFQAISVGLYHFLPHAQNSTSGG
jgi:hypothetical protein